MSESPYKNYIGIDVSKKYLDVCVSSTREYFRVSNDKKGFKELVKRLKVYDACLIVTEGTGGYEAKGVYALQEAGLSCAVVNPRQVRSFGKAIGRIAKTDKIDAGILAHYGEAVKPAVKAKMEPKEQELSESQHRRKQLVDMITMEKNRCETAGSRGVRKNIKKTIDFLEKQLKEMDCSLLEQVNENREWQSKLALLKSVKGVGQVVALTLISELPELGQVSGRAIAALVGVAPFNRDSGGKRGQKAIWGGRANVRSALYMAGLVAVRHNERLRDFYQKLCQAGKKKKVALIACMRKLLVIMNMMVKNNTSWRSSLGENQTVCV